MDDFIKDKEKSIERLKLQNEEEDQKVSLAQKKALEREAKAKYGRDWKKVLGYAGKAARSIRVNKEAMHDLYGMGLGDLKEASRPPRMRGSR